MDFNRKQLDSLSLGYYRGVISYKGQFVWIGPIQG